MIDLPLDELRAAFGFGVAGNFAGHLEQAGEAADFTAVEAATPDAPKGIFPFYVPGDSGFLGTFPFSNDRIALPEDDATPDLQIEPEAAVVCRVAYGSAGGVERLDPYAVAAFNDCSIRRPGAPKISLKKNWGANSKGVAARAFPIDGLDAAGPAAGLRLASFLRREGEAHAYGVDSPVAGYSYFGQTLLDWIVERLTNQAGSETTPLEPVGDYLARAGSPGTVLIAIGATRYTPFGEGTYLRAGDDSVVVVYDSSIGADDVKAAVRARSEADLPGASVLTQTVG